MAEAQSDKPQESVSDKIARILVLARRTLRRWPLALVVGVLAAGAVLAFFLIKKKGYYFSETKVDFHEPVSKDIVRGTETRESFDIVTTLKNFMGSRTTLMSVAKDVGIGQGDLTDPEFTEMLQGQIDYKGYPDGFKISFRGGDPKTVQKMTKTLADRYIAESVASLAEHPRSTSLFITKQTDAAKGEVVKLETELARFKAEHPELIIDPMSGQVSIQRKTVPGSKKVSRATIIAAASDPLLKDALARKGQLEAQIKVLQGGQGTGEASAKEQELADAQKELAHLKLQYTDEWPPVKAQRAKVRSLEEAVAIEKKNGSVGKADSPEIRDLKGRVAAVETEIAQRTKDTQTKNEAARREAAAEDRRNSVPEKKPDPTAPPAETFEDTVVAISGKYAQLTSDLTTAKSSMTELEHRDADGRTLANLAADNSLKAFSVKDPAYLPMRPVRPRRLKVAIFSLLAGLFGGIGAALARVLLDPRIYDEDDLKQACRLPILAAIPRRNRS